MKAFAVRAVVAIGLVAAALVPGMAAGDVSVRETRVALVYPGSGAAQKASNVQCALRAPVQATLRRLGGFVAELSEDEVVRLRTDPEIVAVRPDPASWAAWIVTDDPALIEARARELERKHRFTSDWVRTRAFRGFAAVLSWRQLDRLSQEPDVLLRPDPWFYIVFYRSGVDVDARTDELERQYGFTSRSRLRGLGGFGAELNKAQLSGLAGEPDIEFIGASPSGWIGEPPPTGKCVRSTPRARRLLRAAFVRTHPTLAGRQLRGPFRVRIGSGPLRFALGSFSHPDLSPESQPQAFSFSARWNDLGPTNGVVCTDGERPIPKRVLHAWFLPPSPEGQNCFRTR